MRLTQPPSVFQLPPLPSKSVPVINLFELSKRYQAGEPDFYINQYVNNKMTEVNIKNEDASEYSHQKPNSLASKNNTALRLSIVVDHSTEKEKSESDYKNNLDLNVATEVSVPSDL